MPAGTFRSQLRFNPRENPEEFAAYSQEVAAFLERLQNGGVNQRGLRLEHLAQVPANVRPSSNQPTFIVVNAAGGLGPHIYTWVQSTQTWTALSQTALPAAHVLATVSGLGGQHTVSGLTAGQVLRATAATVAMFMRLTAADVDPGTFPSGAYVYQGALSGITTLAMSGQLTNTVATGAAPFVLSSTTKVVNLNADLLDGFDESAFAKLADDEVVTGSWRFGAGITTWTPTTGIVSILTGLHVGSSYTAPPSGGIRAEGAIQIEGGNVLEMGAGVVGKNVDAGKIGYAAFTADTLDIVGAGTLGTNRKIKFFAEGGATFSDAVSMGDLSSGRVTATKANDEALLANRTGTTGFIGRFQFGGVDKVTISSDASVSTGKLTASVTAVGAPAIIAVTNPQAAALDVGGALSYDASAVQQGELDYRWTGAATTDAKFQLYLRRANAIVKKLEVTDSFDFQSSAVSMGALTATTGLFNGLVNITGGANLQLGTATAAGGDIRMHYDAVGNFWEMRPDVDGSRFAWFQGAIQQMRLTGGSDFSPATAGALTLGTVLLPFGDIFTNGIISVNQVGYIRSSAGLLEFQSGTTGIDFKDSNNAVTRARMTNGGDFLLGTVTAATGNPRLDVVQSGDIAHFVIADNITNLTTKIAGFGVRHYTNAEEPTALLMGASQSASSQVRIGGGSGGMNAVTVIEFYTAATTTTLTGTLAADLTGVGSAAILRSAGHVRAEGEIRAAGGIVDSVGAVDLLLKRNAVTKLTLASASATFADIGIFPASTTSAASVRLPHGSAPTTPTDGDVWTTTAGAFHRINGTTKTVLYSGSIAYTDITYSGLTAGHVWRATSATAASFGTLTNDAFANNTIAHARLVNIAQNEALARTASGTGAVSAITVAGTYTPIVTSIANLDATPTVQGTFRWSRAGNVVTVSGTLTANPTTISTVTICDVSLPVASAFTTGAQLAGSGRYDVAPVAVTSNPTDDRARIDWNTTATSAQDLYVIFSYEVI